MIITTSKTTTTEKQIDITKEEFDSFENVRNSGICNMFDTTTIQEATGLSREKISIIRSNYEKIRNNFLAPLVENWKEGEK